MKRVSKGRRAAKAAPVTDAEARALRELLGPLESVAHGLVMLSDAITALNGQLWKRSRKYRAPR